MEPILLQTSWPLENIWTTAAGFIGIMVLAVSLIGMLSKSLSIPAMGGYLMFAYYATEAPDVSVLQPVLYVTLTLIIIGVAFKLWRTEAVGDTV